MSVSKPLYVQTFYHNLHIQIAQKITWIQFNGGLKGFEMNCMKNFSFILTGLRLRHTQKRKMHFQINVIILFTNRNCHKSRLKNQFMHIFSLFLLCQTWEPHAIDELS